MIKKKHFCNHKDLLAFLLDLIDDKETTYIFRGYKKEQELKPCLLRNEDYLRNEFELLNKFYYNARTFENFNSVSEFYVLVQHYSLPTRLLDFSYNPLVALYFSINSYSQKDADNHSYILCLKSKDKSGELIKEYVIDSYAGVEGSELKLPDGTFLGQIRSRILNGKEDCKGLKILKSNFTNERIFSQQGLFLIDFSEKYFEDLYSINELSGYVVEIDSCIFSVLLRILNTLGINQASLMRDVESVAKYSKESIKSGV